MNPRCFHRLAGAASLVAVVLGGSACKRQTGVPDASSVVGTWVLSSESLALARRLGFERSNPGDHRIVLSADRTCQFRSYWYFAGAPTAPRESDYIPGSTRCSWSVRDALVASRRATVEGALEIVVLEPSGAFIDLEVERVEGRLYLLASTGHPDENGAKFRYELVSS